MSCRNYRCALISVAVLVLGWLGVSPATALADWNDAPLVPALAPGGFGLGGWRPGAIVGQPGPCPGGVCPVPRQPRTFPDPALPDISAAPPRESAPTERSPRFFDPAVQITKGNAGGSGVVIGFENRQAVILTAWHVVEDPGALSVFFPSQGRRVPGRLLTHDAQLDLAGIMVELDFTPAVAPLAHGEPGAGEDVVVAGYGGGRYRERSGNVLGLFDHGRLREADLGVSPLSIPGDSGGPIYSPAGDVVSILWGGPARGPGGPLIRTQGARTLEVRKFAEKLGLPFCLTPSTSELQRLLEELRGSQQQLQTRLAEMERQRDSLIRSIEQGDNATAQRLLDDVRSQLAAARAEINSAKTDAAAAQTAAAEIKGEASGLRKLIDQAFQRIAEASQSQPNASLADILKEAGLATARDAAGDKLGDDRVERLIASVLAAKEAHSQGESPLTASLFAYLQALGIPAGLLALAAAFWRKK